MIFSILVVLIKRPYSSVFDNLGALFCEFVGLFSLILSLTSYFLTFDEEKYTLILFLIQGLVVVASFLSIIRLAIFYKGQFSEFYESSKF